jgi:hypothetical protein
MYSRIMDRPRILSLSMISALLIAIMAIGLFVDTRSSPVALRTPIPASSLAAFRPGNPIENPTQAFVAAQFYLNTTRLRASGDILPYRAEYIRYTEAILRTMKPGEVVDPHSIRHADVWLVRFEGQWGIEPPVPAATPTAAPAASTATQSACVYAVLDAATSEGLWAGGIRPCTDYEIRPAGQIIQHFIYAKGLNILPGTRAYSQMMKDILLGEYPELTTLVHNLAELEGLYAYAGQHLQDGTWRFWGQPVEPDIPEALLPIGTPIPTESYPTQRVWTDTPEAQLPTETPRPTESYPPQAIWYSSVLTVPLPIPPVEAIISGEWFSNTRLQIETGWAQSSGLYWIDFGSGKPVVSTLQPVPTTQQAYSASFLYSVQCGIPLQMINVANQTVISQANLILNPNAMSYCTAYVSWAGDEIAAFAARTDGEWSTYLWQPDGSEPFRVGPALNGAEPPAWSPDGERFAYLNYTAGELHTLQIIIADRYARHLQTIPTNLRLPPTEIRWVGQQALALRDSNKLWQYYEAETGEVLFTWQEAPSMGSNLDHQYPRISPDGRWITIERGGFNTDWVLRKTYSLYEIQNRQAIMLYHHPWHLLEYSGWSPDGERLYLLHLPAGPDAVADPGLPYGLLAFHPLDGQFELLIENAQAVTWDAAFQNALVYVFTPDNAGQAALTAGIWDPTRGQVTGASLITNPPIQYDFLFHPISLNRFVPAAWSPDGQQAVFFNWQGDLVLMGLDGQTQLLASQVGLGRADFTRLLAWSPDGSRLFVSDRGTAWVVTIPLHP